MSTSADALSRWSQNLIGEHVRSLWSGIGLYGELGGGVGYTPRIAFVSLTGDGSNPSWSDGFLRLNYLPLFAALVATE